MGYLILLLFDPFSAGYYGHLVNYHRNCGLPRLFRINHGLSLVSSWFPLVSWFDIVVGLQFSPLWIV
jgi:hypothetical protein